MPRRQETKKDVVSCEKPRSRQQAKIRGYPNGGTWHGKTMSHLPEHIGQEGKRGELKHLSTFRRRKQERFPK